VHEKPSALLSSFRYDALCHAPRTEICLAFVEQQFSPTPSSVATSATPALRDVGRNAIPSYAVLSGRFCHTDSPRRTRPRATADALDS